MKGRLYLGTKNIYIFKIMGNENTSLSQIILYLINNLCYIERVFMNS